MGNRVGRGTHALAIQQHQGVARVHAADADAASAEADPGHSHARAATQGIGQVQHRSQLDLLAGDHADRGRRIAGQAVSGGGGHHHRVQLRGCRSGRCQRRRQGEKHGAGQAAGIGESDHGKGASIVTI
ncbi:hypothetical protein D3C72_1716430 [compost metagenome]